MTVRHAFNHKLCDLIFYVIALQIADQLSQRKLGSVVFNNCRQWCRVRLNGRRVIHHGQIKVHLDRCICLQPLPILCGDTESLDTTTGKILFGLPEHMVCRVNRVMHASKKLVPGGTIGTNV